MSGPEPPGPEPQKPAAQKREPISLPDLIVLNEEIAALVRAGIPIEVGLGAATGLPKRLAAITDRLRQELEQGATLPEALRRSGAELPASYLAIIEAGLRSNRLSDGLISAAAFARSLLDMQQHLRTALIYPTIVLCVAYGFFLFLLRDLTPRMESLLIQIDQKPNALLADMEMLSRTLPWWGPVLPILVLLIAIAFGLVPMTGSGRPAATLRRLKWLPWIGRIVTDFQRASFCRLLSVLVERETPLPDALELAASASADAGLNRECHQIAVSLRKGAPLEESLRSARRLPVFTRWMLSTGQAQGRSPPQWALWQTFITAEHSRRLTCSRCLLRSF